MATIISDTFNRANSTNVVGAPQTGPSPTVVAGTWGILNNQLYCSASTSNAEIKWATGVADMDITIVLGVSDSSDFNLMFRIQDSTNFWQLSLSTSYSFELFKSVNNGFSSAGQPIPSYDPSTGVTRNPAAGDTFRLLCIGPLIMAFWNGGCYTSIDDSTFQTNQDMGFRFNNTSNPGIDNLLVQNSPNTLTVAGLIKDDVSPYKSALVSGSSWLYKGRDTYTLDSGSVP